MKLLIGYIRPHKVDEEALALHQVAGLTGMSVSTARSGRLRPGTLHDSGEERRSELDPTRRPVFA